MEACKKLADHIEPCILKGENKLYINSHSKYSASPLPKSQNLIRVFWKSVQNPKCPKFQGQFGTNRSLDKYYTKPAQGNNLVSNGTNSQNVDGGGSNVFFKIKWE